MRALLLLLAVLLLAPAGLAQGEEQKLTASDQEAFDRFGTSVARQGDLAVVGAFYDDCDTGPTCGAAYVYERQPDGTWAETQKLTAPGAQFFGIDVAITREIDPVQIVVGAHLTDCTDGEDCGAVYVFGKQPGGTWAENQKLVADDAGAGDWFGVSVDAFFEYIVVGAPNDDCAAGEDCGAVYRFRRGTSGDWTQEVKVAADDAAADDRFGQDVSITFSAFVLIGAPGDDCAAGEDCGAAYFFTNTTTLVQDQKLTASDRQAGDAFGFAVDFELGTYVGGISPRYGELHIGAPLQDCAAGADCGAVYSFRSDTPSGFDYIEEQKITASDADAGDTFGIAVMREDGRGENLVIGAHRADCAAGSDCGAAYGFTLGYSGLYTETSILTASDADAGDRFGIALALDGDEVFVGAQRDDCDAGDDCGAVYLFDLAEVANMVPIADAGDDQTVVVGQTVTLDGSGSSDPDDDALDYDWTLAGPGSPALADAETSSPTFCAAEAGAYAATLVVNDGTDDSEPDEVAVTALSVDAALDVLGADVADLGPVEEGGDGTLNGGQANALLVKLRQAQRKLERGQDPTPHFGAFRSQVQRFEDGGILSPEQAAALLAALDAIDEATNASCASDAGASAPTASSTAGVPDAFVLHAAYPNPLRSSATLAFEVPTSTTVQLAVFDALGRTVAVLAEGPVEAGRHEASFDAQSLPSGVYLVRMTTDDGFAQTQRLTVLR